MPARARAGCICTRRSDDVDPSRLILLGQVRRALEREEFVLHYQPKVDLLRRRVTGVEALVRWRHPEHGLLGPGEFIPQIEPTALVGPFTIYVIERALQQMVAWRRRGIDLEMSVNLTARNLLDPALPAQIDELRAAPRGAGRAAHRGGHRERRARRPRPRDRRARGFAHKRNRRVGR